MTEQELRALVRDVIARHSHAAGGPGSAAPAAADASLSMLRWHPSHGLLAIPSGGDAAGPCLIEPAVPCNHCGYCKSYGH